MATATFVQTGEQGVASRLELDTQLNQTLVDGYIVTVQAARVTFIVNEDGKTLGLPVNEPATLFLYTSFAPEWRGQDVLCGPVWMIGEDEDGAADVALCALIYFGLDT